MMHGAEPRASPSRATSRSFSIQLYHFLQVGVTLLRARSVVADLSRRGVALC